MTGRVQFVGIGGAGMSVVAELFLARGHAVSGSDAKDSAALQRLAGLGEQGFEDAPFGQRQADVVIANARDAARRAVAQVAKLQLARRGRRLAAPQHGT